MTKKLFYVVLIAILIVVTFGISTSYAMEMGGIEVVEESTDASVEYNNGIIYIHSGTVSLSGEAGANVIVDGDAIIKLDNLNITASNGPAISIKAGKIATVVLEGENVLIGADNYAGLEVENINDVLASLIIEGNGKLSATGKGSAGIGGSKSNGTLSGNITINNGTIIANGEGGGAGIGTARSSANIKANTDQYGTITINGGNITADGYDGGAGIGGGNHADSGKIIINNGIITHSQGRGGGAGIGSGIGSTKPKNGNEGPGYFYADIEINGGVIKEAISEWLGAGIGGGYECDAYIKISGGTIENTIGGNGNSGSLYQGGPGIGGGYQGLMVLEISGGTILNAKGGTGAPGIGYGPAALSSKRTGAPTISYDDSLIKISGGTFELVEGGIYASGIGSGNGNEKCNIEITGGNFNTIKGYQSSLDEKSGAAGIGSGVGENDTHVEKYKADTELSIVITGGTMENVIGGWGASGIGSGANNEVIRNLNIETEKTEIKAYSDGTKPAIEDTVSGNNTITINGKVLQATVSDLIDTSGGKKFDVYNYANTIEKYDIEMPDSYKTFGVIVKDESVYVVKGDGTYFSTKATPGIDIPSGSSSDPLLPVTNNISSNHNYLYPANVQLDPVVRKLKFKENEWTYDSSEHKGQGIIEGKYTDSYTIYYKLDGEEEWTEELPKITNVGELKVSLKAISSKDYETLELNDAILKVNPRKIVITIKNEEKIVGDKDPSYTYTYDKAQVFEDDVKKEIDNLVLSRKPGEKTGIYEITAEEKKFDNYVLVIKRGKLTIKDSISQEDSISTGTSTSNHDSSITNNPKTYDNIKFYIGMIIFSSVGFWVVTRYKK